MACAYIHIRECIRAQAYVQAGVGALVRACGRIREGLWTCGIFDKWNSGSVLVGGSRAGAYVRERGRVGASGAWG